MLDVDRKEIIFYHNGKPLQAFSNVFEQVLTGFFAAASFMSFQQCQVIFFSRNFHNCLKKNTFQIYFLFFSLTLALPHLNILQKTGIFKHLTTTLYFHQRTRLFCPGNVHTEMPESGVLPGCQGVPTILGRPGAADFAHSSLVAPPNDLYLIFKIAGPFLVSKKIDSL